jgi:hypothetical protein
MRSPLMEAFHDFAFRYVGAIRRQENVRNTVRNSDAAADALSDTKVVEDQIEQHFRLIKAPSGAVTRR